MKFLGDRLYELRVDNDIKQFEIANKLNIKNTTWSNYEKNVRAPNIDLLKNISDYFKVSLDYLLGIIPYKYNPRDPIFVEIIKIFVELDEAQKKSFIKYLKQFKGADINVSRKTKLWELKKI